MDRKGRVLKGRRINFAATAKLYSPYFKPPKGTKQAQRKAVGKYAEFYYGHSKAGLKPIRATRNNAKLAKVYGVNTPEGSTVTFLPNKFAGKKVSFENGIPKVTGKSTVTYIHPINFYTPEFLDEIEQIDDPESQYSQLEEEARKFIQSIPKRKGEMLTIAMATGDYLKGSDFDREDLVKRLAELMQRFVRSKGAQQLGDFVTAVNVIVAK